ncbi:AI-2E family transporter [Nesterenkonia xinjiangensis]|uniref:Putative PurR-regulated permease PerM n=1 Tax=Nesterenkonia xinjiangensis TaxID=225327 RepID=A0A7Z0K7L1_9MICC|nr:putative PurR-regulated permease PerM [Nesterenkonia xinjiangensis]
MSLLQRALRRLTPRGRRAGTEDASPDAPARPDADLGKTSPRRISRLRRSLRPILEDPDEPVRRYDAYGLPPEVDPSPAERATPGAVGPAGSAVRPADGSQGTSSGSSPQPMQDEPSGHPDTAVTGVDVAPTDSSPPGPTQRDPTQPDPRAPRALQQFTQTTRPVYTGFMFTVGVGLALLIFYIGQTNTQLLVWIGAALFIALGLDPVVRALERLGLPRPAGVTATMLTFVTTVASFIAWLAPAVTQQMSNFATSIPQIVYDMSRTPWFRRLDDDFQLQDIIDTEVSRFVADSSNITNALGGLFGVGAAVLTTGFGMLVVAVLALYFLASLPTMKAWGYRLVPRTRRPRIQHLGERILNGVGYYVIGQACVAFLNGVVAYIAITIAGVPFGALFAVVVGVLAFIPLVGPVTGGSLVTLVALTVDWQTALTFAAIYFIYLQIEAYLVSPRIMSRAVKIPAAVAVISVIAGGTLLGVLGALMAIPTAAALMLLIREVLITHQDSR